LKVVFVCSPYRGTEEEVRENTALAKRVCRKAALDGHLVICPHLFYPSFLNDAVEAEREIGIASGLRLLEYADEVWVVDGRITSGMAREIARAGELGIPTRCVVDPKAAEEHLMNAVMGGKE
jgi:hypothetical protein